MKLLEEEFIEVKDKIEDIEYNRILELFNVRYKSGSFTYGECCKSRYPPS